MQLVKRYLTLLIGVWMVISCKNEEPEQPNILFIAVDDLRPELGCYGNETVQSPHIDALASEGTLYKNHYVSVPTCGASRHAMLTGLNPISRTHLSNRAFEVLMHPDSTKEEGPETFIHQLRNNGYYTVGIGKISHNPEGKVYEYLETNEGARTELPNSWDEMLFNSDKWGTGHNAFFGYADGTNRNTLKKQVKPYEAADVNDEGYPDGLTAKLASEKIKELTQKNKPFFLAVGFFKPHLPFTAPKKYWDLYNENEINLAPFQAIPNRSGASSLQASGEFNQYALGEEKASLSESMSNEYQRKLKHAYYACVSYTDAQIGKLINTLKDEGLYENTIIVLWGDHGWHLGDHNVWGKHTCFERALHSPLIIKGQNSEGQVVDNIVSSVDIYPTLMELTQTAKPEGLSGTSLSNVSSPGWVNRAFSYYRNGVSVRNERYRLTKYYRGEEIVYELYDHLADPFETNNIVDSHSEVVEKLQPLLAKADNGLYQKP